MSEPILAALPDDAIVALTLFGEARGEGPEGRIAVANVVRNRMAGTGKSARDVCLQRRQFSCWNANDPNRDVLVDTAAAMQNPGGRIGPVLNECRWIAHGLLTDSFVDNTHGATHYVTNALYATRPPYWVKDARPLCVIGRHTFFRVAL